MSLVFKRENRIKILSPYYVIEEKDILVVCK